MKQIRISNVYLITLSVIVSSVTHISTLMNPNRLSYAGGDIFHNIWTYKRNWSYLLSFDSNFLNQIQYPTKGSAFTAELQLGNTLFFKLITLFVKSEIHAYGLMLFFSGVLIFFSIYKIMIFLRAHEVVGLVMATYATTAMYLSNHISHIQVISFFWLTIPIWLTFELSKPDPTFKRTKQILLFISTFLLFTGPSYLNIILVFSIMTSTLMAILLTLLKSNNLILDFQKLKSDIGMYLQSTFKIILSALFFAFFFWIPYLLQAFESKNVRTVSQASTYRVDLANFLNPSLNNWFYGQHNFSNFAMSGDSLFPGVMLIVLFLIGLFSSGLKFSLLQLYVMWSGLFLILISLSSPITIFGYAISPNPIFLIFAGLGGLSATRYLPTLAFFGSLFVLLAATARINFFASWKLLKVWVSALLICAFIILENAPSNSLILPTQPRLSSDWTSLKATLSGEAKKYVGIYPGPSLPLDPADPLFWTQFEWMAGLAEVPLKFIGGNSGFIQGDGLEMMAKLHKQKILKSLPLESCLIKKKCLLIIDKNGLKQVNSQEQLGFFQNRASLLGLSTWNSDQFFLIGLAAQEGWRANE